MLVGDPHGVAYLTGGQQALVSLPVGNGTWGGLDHTADTPPFIDGGSMIAPRGGFFTREGKWAVENEGTAPDIDVENWPKEVIAGHDPQLERAVQEAMRQLKERPVNRMATEPPPPTWGTTGAPARCWSCAWARSTRARPLRICKGEPIS